MFKRSNVWRGMTLLFTLLFVISLMTASIFELYRTSVDAFFGTRSQMTVTEHSDDDADAWTFQSNYKTAKEAYEGLREFAIREAEETFVLLKNENGALPIQSNAKITMLGVRSYAPVYGSNGGSIADGYSTVEITDAFTEKGFQLNPSTLAAYSAFFADKEWTTPQFGGGIIPEYAEITAYNDPHEFTLDELRALNPDFDKDYAEYSDAAIVVVGRPNGESGNGFYPGADGLADGVHTVTGNILSLSDEEMAIVEEAKANFDKVIVLVNSTNPMELGNLENDPEIDAILWIGYPGCYGFYAVADVLTGAVSPSAHLGDVFAKNSALAPAMQNYGNIPWTNADSFSADANVNSYLVQAESIYSGYRYYETRYADIVLGNGGAQASAGTYANPDGTVATAAGTWDYANEVVYPFGYGLSYTTFQQTLDSVEIMGSKEYATVTVTVTNTGSAAGKSVIQLYAQTPYTDYDKQNGIEKSAVQLMDFEKTDTLQPGASQTITMKVDLANLASYDAVGAKTFILDSGDYYFAIGEDSHDALNNILAAQGKTTADGMTASGDSSKTYQWTWNGLDADTFSVSKAGTPITNALTEGDYAMDLNAFLPGTVTYLSRSDWDGTFPKTYSGLAANDTLSRLLNNDLYTIKTGEDTSDLVFGDKTSTLTINDLKGADFDDPRWAELVGKVTVDEFLNFATNAFHNIANIDSVGLLQYAADDGPGGSDSHYLTEGMYQGVPYEDAAGYEYATRVAPAPVNLAYSWNKELAYENGEIIMGESTLVLNLPIMIGPGMNLHRHAYNSRGVEYYSEDPILSGYIGSAVVQGAQSKGCLVNIKHAAFNDQEINRSGIAVFMTEQRARELELRNLQQAFEANGKPASFEADESRADTYTTGALGVMTSYNRIGAVPSSANRGVMVDIMRNEWGFKGYNVTDFTGVALKASPKESIMAGTTAFCGFGVAESITYWDGASLSGDREMLEAVKQNTHYLLYALANSAAMNGVNATTHTENVMTWWRGMYIAFIAVTAVGTVVCVGGYAATQIKKKRGN